MRNKYERHTQKVNVLCQYMPRFIIQVMQQRGSEAEYAHLVISIVAHRSRLHTNPLFPSEHEKPWGTSSNGWQSGLECAALFHDNFHYPVAEPTDDPTVKRRLVSDRRIQHQAYCFRPDAGITTAAISLRVKMHTSYRAGSVLLSGLTEIVGRWGIFHHTPVTHHVGQQSVVAMADPVFDTI